jgi:hypothetical protein
VELGRLTPQNQPRITWEPSFAVVRSRLDQLVRANRIEEQTLRQAEKLISAAGL